MSEQTGRLALECVDMVGSTTSLFRLGFSMLYSVIGDLVLC